MFDVLIPIYPVLFLLVLFASLAYLDLGGASLVVFAALPSYLLRTSIFGLPTNLLELFILVLVTVAVLKYRRALFEKNSFLKKLFAPLLLIAVGLGVGLGVSQGSLVAWGIIKGWFVLPFLLAFTMYFLVRRGRVRVRNLLMALAVSSMGLSLIAWGQVVSGVFVGVDGRASSIFASPNYLAMFLVPVLFLTLGWLLVFWNGGRLGGWFMLTSFILGVGALYFSFSYGGYLAFGAGLFIFLLVLGVRFWFLAGGTMLGVGLIGLLQGASQKFQSLFNLSRYSSYSVRLEVWKAAWLMIKENWFAGIGLGNFKNLYTAFVKKAIETPHELLVLHAHNLYLYFWLNLGLAGLVGFLWLVGRVGYEFYGLVRNSPRALAASFMAAFSAILVHGLVDTTYWKYDLAILFWLLIALIFALNYKESRWV